MERDRRISRVLSLYTAAALSLMLSACAGPYSTLLGDTEAQRNGSVEQAFVHAWNMPNDVGISDLFAADAEVRDIPLGAVYMGHSQITSRMQRMLSDMNRLRMEVLSSRRERNLVVLEWQITGSFGGEEAIELGIDDLPIVLQGISVLVMRKGKVIRSTELYDLASVAYQLQVQYTFPEAQRPVASANANLTSDCTLR